MARLNVRKTYKLYINGEFPRSESGRSFPVNGKGGELLANVSRGSRKDLRNAVAAARKAFSGWSGKTAYNRGQILYRAAELIEGRRSQFVEEVQAGEGLSRKNAEASVDAATDRLVWYAGWADKIAQVVGGTNPVSAPYFDFSIPEPTGIVGVLAPQDSSLLGFVSVVAPLIVTGNTVVVAASTARPLPAITFAEVLATSDLPGGVVNVLTGPQADTAPTLASHMDVNAIDLTGALGNDEVATELEVAAADNLKRVRRPRPEDWTTEPALDRMTWALETKTVWHPIGI
jgi:acyl-CoA reductase-like NAD-dependent aldehyde dehydrogenase